HYCHVDCQGQVTFVYDKAGVKLWTIAVPIKETDMGSTYAFSGSYSRYDFSNDQKWRIYNILLRPGDLLIMNPGVLHYVLTLEDAICLGGHAYSSQTLQATAFAIFHSFVASDILTNTTHFHAVEGLQSITSYWKTNIVDNATHFKNLVKRSSHIIPHLPNLLILRDLVGCFSLLNLMMLGSILDVRRYFEEDREMDLWDH
ncbi:hypothetical protein BDP27DRAFT_1198527, partial [Rhodocollybia butyracea]